MNGAIKNTYFNNVNIYAISSDFILALSSYTMFMHIRTMKDCNEMIFKIANTKLIRIYEKKTY